MLEPGPPQDLCEPAQPWRAHRGVITEIDCAQKYLITETDSCSLLWNFFFYAQNSFMFSTPVFSAKSLTALPPTAESQTCPAQRSPPQLRCSIPVLPQNPPPSSPKLSTASPWDALGKLGGQNSSGREEVTWRHTELISGPHRPLFQLAQASYHLPSPPAQPLGKRFMSWWRKVSPSSFWVSYLEVQPSNLSPKEIPTAATFWGGSLFPQPNSI